MSATRTEHGDFVFKVSEHTDGTPWIWLEPCHSNPEFQNILLGFDLRSNKDIHDAEKLANYLNEHIETLSITFFNGARITSEETNKAK